MRNSTAFRNARRGPQLRSRVRDHPDVDTLATRKQALQVAALDALSVSDGYEVVKNVIGAVKAVAQRLKHWSLSTRRRKLKHLLLLFALAVAAGILEGHRVSYAAPGLLRYPDLARLFSYVGTAPLEPRQERLQINDGLRQLTVSFRSPLFGRVSGYLVLPRGRGPFPTVIWMGGLDGSKEDMLSEAIDLAHSGAAGLLLDAAVARPPFPRLFEYDVNERRTWIRNVIDIRRGIDYLRSRGDMNMVSVGYVGFSFGADTGTIVAAVDHRLRAVVIASGGASQRQMLEPGGFFYKKVGAKRRAAYMDVAIKPFEPFRYAAHLAPAAVFFQHGKTDPAFSRSNQMKLDTIASSPKKVSYYDAGHSLNSEATRDRKVWLLTQLGLK